MALSLGDSLAGVFAAQGVLAALVVAAPDIRGYFAGDCNPSASGTP